MLLLRGATETKGIIYESGFVSIHAPLARSNCLALTITLYTSCFNTCSSCEEQLARKLPNTSNQIVSIHAPLARSNTLALTSFPLIFCFNTCSSCEEQQSLRRYAEIAREVSIHAPLARSNLFKLFYCLFACQFQYMLLLRGATAILPVHLF